MEVVLHADVASFLARARGFLLADEPVHGLVLGLCEGVARRGDADADAIFASAGGDEVAAIYMRTPPWKAIVSRAAAGMASLARVMVDRDREAPGVGGPDEASLAFARARVARTGEPMTPGLGMRIHRLDEVVEPAWPKGHLREAAAGDRPLLDDWAARFVAETGADDPRTGPEIVEALRAGGELHVWELAGRVRSVGALVRPTPRGISISYVYTPADERGRGFASAVVAQLSRRALASGRQFVTLFTDRKNPTSNRIYARIGFFPVCAWQDYWFFRRPHPPG